VAHPREHQATGDAGALDGSDGGLGDLAPATAHPQVHLHLTGVPLVATLLVDVVPPHDGLVVVAHVVVAAGGAQVVAGREVLAVAGQHDHLDLVVLDGLLEGRVERVGHDRVLGIAIVGAIQGDDRDAVTHLVGDDIGLERDGHDFSSRRTFFSTLPDGFRGSASTNRTERGALKLASFSRAYAITSSSVSGCPSSGTTNARPTSPMRSSGTPITPTSWTPGRRSSAASTSAG